MKLNCSFDTTKGRTFGELIRQNSKTVIVKTQEGKFIKRHNIKHAVKINDERSES